MVIMPSHGLAVAGLHGTTSNYSVAHAIFINQAHLSPTPREAHEDTHPFAVANYEARKKGSGGAFRGKRTFVSGNPAGHGVNHVALDATIKKRPGSGEALSEPKFLEEERSRGGRARCRLSGLPRSAARCRSTPPSLPTRGASRISGSSPMFLRAACHAEACRVGSPNHSLDRGKL